MKDFLNLKLFQEFLEIAKLIHDGKYTDLDNFTVSEDDLFIITIGISSGLAQSVKNDIAYPLLYYYTMASGEYLFKTKKQLDIKTFLKVWMKFADTSKKHHDSLKNSEKKMNYLQ